MSAPLDHDPGPVPSRFLEEDDIHDPYIELLQWIFKGRSSVADGMRPDQRINWMRRNLPHTYALLTLGHRWAELADL